MMLLNSLSELGLLSFLPLALAVPKAPIRMFPRQNGTFPSSVVPSSGVPSSGVYPGATGTSSRLIPTGGPPVVPHPSSLPHGPYNGSQSTPEPNPGGQVPGGPVTGPAIGGGVPTSGQVAPTATTYPSDGQLHNPQPGPYIPAGGVGTSGEVPVYRPQSDFDFESLALALYQEYIELDLFHDGLARFSEEDFEAAGLTAEDRYLIQFMAEQEVGHATMLTNILGPNAPKQCTYNYPYTTVQEYIDFCQKLTRFGEAGVYGFLTHLNSRESAGLLLQSITTEARQQQIFRQFEGLFPMPEWFEVGIPQSWAWTLLAPYISSCPPDQTGLVWQNFPALFIINQPNPIRINAASAQHEILGGGTNALNSSNVPTSDLCYNSDEIGVSCKPAITRNRTQPLSFPGRQIQLSWDPPGNPIGPNNSYTTSSTAGAPRFVAWVSQLNVTYSPLTTTGNGREGTTLQPDLSTYEGDPAINGTIFVAITDSDPYLTPFNLSMINSHVVAGPAMYQAG